MSPWNQGANSQGNKVCDAGEGRSGGTEKGSYLEEQTLKLTSFSLYYMMLPNFSWQLLWNNIYPISYPI